MEVLIPEIEENIPLPANAKEACPNLSVSQELEMRANIVKLFSDITGQPLTATQDNVSEAKELAREMAANPTYRPEFANYPNETLALLAGMVAQMNVAIVADLAELKLYVVNSLIREIENSANAKERIMALTKLGEVDGVDAFKKRTEVTHKIQSMEEVEKELLETLESIEARTIDVTPIRLPRIKPPKWQGLFLLHKILSG